MTWSDRLLLPVWFIAYYAFLILFALGAVLFGLACTLAHPVLGRRPGVQRSTRRLIHRLVRVYVGALTLTRGLRVHWHGLEKIPPGQGILFIANHPSILDAPLFLARFPDLACVFKSGLRKHLVLPQAAAMAGYMSNDAGIDAIRSAVEHLRAGTHVLIFPEGTRTRSGALNPLDPGFALFAQRHGRPVQSILIRTNSDILSKRCPFWRFPIVPARFDLEIGDCFQIAPGSSLRGFTREVETRLRQQLEP